MNSSPKKSTPHLCHYSGVKEAFLNTLVLGLNGHEFGGGKSSLSKGLKCYDRPSYLVNYRHGFTRIHDFTGPTVIVSVKPFHHCSCSCFGVVHLQSENH